MFVCLIMEFRTIIDIQKADFEIPPFERMLFVGSCFSEYIGKRFQEEKFKATVNPFGVMYNPASILHTIERCEEAPCVAVFTLGTNHVYRFKETGEIVDNCKKLPPWLFQEEELTVDQCVEYLSQAVDTLLQRYVEARVIVTVSPIRYAKYGFHGSQLSKSTLLLATDQLVKKYAGRVAYFPAYEIVNDELRDYRFYKEDMLHPSDQAVKYIWQRFGDMFFGEDVRTFLKEWRPIKEALKHRPFRPKGEGYIEFIQKTKERAALLSEKYGFDLLEE